MNNQALDNFSQQMLHSAINGINEAVANERNKKLKECTNKQLLQELGERIATGEIRKSYFKGFPYLGVWEEKSGKRIIYVCLTTGRIDPDQSEKCQGCYSYFQIQELKEKEGYFWCPTCQPHAGFSEEEESHE